MACTDKSFAGKVPVNVRMAAICAPAIEQSSPLPTETLPQRRAGGWSLHPQPRVGLNLGSDDELLLLENKTDLPWVVYHKFHQLGVIDPGELLAFHLYKHGTLQARPCASQDSVEYLVLSLHYNTYQVSIYRRRLSDDVEVFDMRAL